MRRPFRAQATTVYELRFGAAALGLDGLAEGLQLGVGVCVNDGDTGDGQVPVVAVFPRECAAQPASFGPTSDALLARPQGGQKGWSGWGPYAVVHGKVRPSHPAPTRASCMSGAGANDCLIARGKAPGAAGLVTLVQG